MTRAAPRSPFFAGLWSGAAPFFLWAAHFAFCYLAVAIGCTALHVPGGLAPSSGGLRTLLLAATAAALVAGAVLLVRACRALRRRHDDLLPTARAVGAALALVGMVWTAWPVAVLPVCAAPTAMVSPAAGGAPRPSP